MSSLSHGPQIDSSPADSQTETLPKLRRAMVQPGRERLSGRVEVDETYVGGAEEGLRGRQTQKKHW